MEGDWEANYACYALQNFGIRPGEFVDMPASEKQFVIACIELIDEERREKNKAGGQ